MTPLTDSPPIATNDVRPTSGDPHHDADDSHLEALPWTWWPWVVPTVIAVILVAGAVVAVVATVVFASHPGPTGGGG